VRLIKSVAVVAGLWAGTVMAAPTTYIVDPSHTYPSFEADHMGLSTWRGKFNKSEGKIVLDRENKSGTVDITVDIKSIDFGHDEMNAHALRDDMFNADKWPTATFKGKFTEFDGDKPEEATGEFTLMGVTKTVKMDIDDFKCIDHPMEKREACGADVTMSFDRTDYGLDFGIDMGFNPEVKLAIQVEALKEQ